MPPRLPPTRARERPRRLGPCSTRTRAYATIREGRPQFITPESVRRRVAVMEKTRKAGGFY